MNIIRASVRDILSSTQPGTCKSVPLPVRNELGNRAHAFFRSSQTDSEHEVHVKYTYTGFPGVELNVTGRVDIVKTLDDKVTLIEFKSVALPTSLKDTDTRSLSSFLDLQVKIYAYIYLKTHPCLKHEQVFSELVLYNLIDESQLSLPIAWTVKEVERTFDLFIESKLADSSLRSCEINRRREIARNIKWPYAAYRTGQQDVIETINKAFKTGRDIIIQAPPGSGKTISIIFPALKTALRNGGQVYFATAKTGGRNPALFEIRELLKLRTNLRALVLSASISTCSVSDPSSCSVNECRYFDSRFMNISYHQIYKRLPEYGLLDLNGISEIAESLKLCPVLLSRLLVEWADIVIGDYNFVFDYSVKLPLFRQKQKLNWWLLVDEAHNLVDRSRDNFSIELKRELIISCQDALFSESWRRIDEKTQKKMIESLDNLKSAFESLFDDFSEDDIFTVNINNTGWLRIVDQYNLSMARYLAETWGRLDEDTSTQLWELYYLLDIFCYLIERDNEAFQHYACRSESLIGVACIDPGSILKEAYHSFRGMVLFSATLRPEGFHLAALGLGDRELINIDVWDFIHAEQRTVVLAPGINTHYKLRPANARMIAGNILKFIGCRNGGYLVFLPSFEFIDLIKPYIYNLVERQNSRISHDEKEINMYIQTRETTLSERKSILDQLNNPEVNTVVMAVAGGQFAEAENYAGDSCVGVVIVSPCLPPPDFQREMLRAYWENRGEDGYGAAYLYPGVRKVIQAAGRMIRGEKERGVVLLMCDRFLDRSIFELLPDSWQDDLRNGQENWLDQVRQFWIRPTFTDGLEADEI